MLHNKNGQAQTLNEPCQVITSHFSESKQEIRNLFVDGEPRFVGADVANALGYKNVRDALRQHCRYVAKCDIPHPQNPEKKLCVSIIPESDVYRLIIKSTLPSAEKFERWVMEDVLPSLRKRGYYGMQRPTQSNFIDARNVPFYHTEINGFSVRTIQIKNEEWWSVNDINKSIRASTASNQIAKKLNAVEVLAVKIFIYGNTHPAWFTNNRGLALVLSGSRKNAVNTQLSLALGNGGAQ